MDDELVHVFSFVLEASRAISAALRSTEFGLEERVVPRTDDCEVVGHGWETILVQLVLPVPLHFQESVQHVLNNGWQLFSSLTKDSVGSSDLEQETHLPKIAIKPRVLTLPRCISQSTPTQSRDLVLERQSSH